jgi:YegS/Rv2252/BmrU family lipid kinase
LSAPRTAAIVNPRAASGKAAARWPSLVQKIGLVEAVFTQRPGHAESIARELLDQGFNRILAVGGDGTISETVNGFFRNGAPIRPEAELGLIPMGTGGDFRRTAGIPDLDAAIAAILGGRTRTIDAARISFESHSGGRAERYFVNLASFGMGGEVALRAKNFLSSTSGKLAFLYATIDVFFRYRPKTVELSLDGAPPTRHTILNIAIGNGRYHGGGMHVCPKAELDDGILDVTIIDSLSMFTLAKDLPVLYSDNLYKHPRTHHARAHRITATSNEKVSIEIDGEALGTLPLEAKIVPGALRLIVP